MFFPSHADEQQVFLAFLLAGMMSAGIPVYAASWPIFAVYGLGIVAPFTYVLATFGNRLFTELALLVPMVLAGAASAVYWIATERAGAGNVVPYAVVQGYAVVILLVFALALPSRYTRGSDVYWVFAGYVIAKLLEHFDREVLALGNLVSGHTLKHLAAAVAGLVLCRMLWRRTLVADERPRLVG